MLALIGVATGLVALHLAVESGRHDRRLRRIPIRIHVNGTRGKTTVTRRIAAALRAAGVRTVGKVTGDEPRLILPDGTEQPIRRRGPARIQEQVWVVREAERWQAEAVVVECMALAPELQRVSEARMICSTLGVITNVRPDHFEIMGASLEEIAAALAATIPERGILVTAERRHFDRLAAVAAARGSRIVLAGDGGDRRDPLAPEEEHAAIVDAVLAELGLPALRQPSPPAAACVWRWRHPGGWAYFVNAFSANDPESTWLLLRRAEAEVTLPGPRVALWNNRADRPCRLAAFGAALRSDRRFAAVCRLGELPGLARRHLSGGAAELRDWPAGPPGEAEVAALAARAGGGDVTLVGLGNAKGEGLEWARFFAEKGEPCH